MWLLISALFIWYISCQAYGEGGISLLPFVGIERIIGLALHIDVPTFPIGVF